MCALFPNRSRYTYEYEYVAALCIYLFLFNIKCVTVPKLTGKGMEANRTHTYADEEWQKRRQRRQLMMMNSTTNYFIVGIAGAATSYTINRLDSADEILRVIVFGWEASRNEMKTRDMVFAAENIMFGKQLTKIIIIKLRSRVCVRRRHTHTSHAGWTENRFLFFSCACRRHKSTVGYHHYWVADNDTYIWFSACFCTRTHTHIHDGPSLLSVSHTDKRICVCFFLSSVIWYWHIVGSLLVHSCGIFNIFVLVCVPMDVRPSDDVWSQRIHASFQCEKIII